GAIRRGVRLRDEPHDATARMLRAHVVGDLHAFFVDEPETVLLASDTDRPGIASIARAHRAPGAMATADRSRISRIRCLADSPLAARACRCHSRRPLSPRRARPCAS